MWRGRRVAEVRIRSLRGQRCRLRLPHPSTTLSAYRDEQPIQVARKHTEMSFPTEPGAVYLIR
jgi:hypothetical protein